MDLNKLTTDVLSQISKTCDKFMETARTIDFNAIVEETEKRFNDLKDTCEKELAQLRNRTKSTEDYFIVDTNYDRDNETLKVCFDGNSFCVTVQSESDNGRAHGSCFTTLIPDAYDINNFTNEYDSENKKMIFKFTRKN